MVPSVALNEVSAVVQPVESAARKSDAEALAHVVRPHGRLSRRGRLVGIGRRPLIVVGCGTLGAVGGVVLGQRIARAVDEQNYGLNPPDATYTLFDWSGIRATATGVGAAIGGLVGTLAGKAIGVAIQSPTLIEGVPANDAVIDAFGQAGAVIGGVVGGTVGDLIGWALEQPEKGPEPTPRPQPAQPDPSRSDIDGPDATAPDPSDAGVADAEGGGEQATAGGNGGGPEERSDVEEQTDTEPGG